MQRPFQIPPAPKYKNFIGSWPSKLEVELEVGCGNGYHLIHRTRQQADLFYLGFERTHQKFQKAQKTLSLHAKENTNFCLIHGNAENWLSHELSHLRFRTIYFLPQPLSEILTTTPSVA